MILKDNYELINFIKLYNNTIREAVTHGGDSGGSYFCNDAGLRDSIAEMIAQISIDNNELIKEYPLAVAYDEDGNIPLIVILVK